MKSQIESAQEVGQWDGYLAFKTRGSGDGIAERMRISSNGFVGIGTSSPVGILDVRGGVNGIGAGTSINIFSQSALQSGLSSTGGNINITAGDGYAGGGGGNIILTSGKGQTAGSYGNGSSITLTGSSAGPSGAAGAITLFGGNGNNGYGNGGTISISKASSANGAHISISGGSPSLGNANGGNILIDGGSLLGSGTDGNVLLASSRGLVGIGPSAPTAQLGVYKSSGTATIQVAAGSSGTPQASRMILGADNSNSGSPYSATRMTYTNSSGNDIFYMDGLAGGSATAAFFVTNPANAFGRVGIGYFGNIYATNIDAGLTVQSKTSSSSDWAFDVFNSSSSKIFAVRSDGNVGIGTTTPYEKLAVNGNIKVAKNSAQPYACDANRDGVLALTSQYTICVCKSGTSTWVQTSDGLTNCVW